jgi:hypothetical protein
VARRKFQDDELHWYAIDVMRQKEFLAGYFFNKRGCMTFIPTMTKFQKRSRYAKGKVEVVRPEFPGTVFVGFPEAPNWFQVMSMNLVNGVLSVPDSMGRVYPRRIDTASRDWINYRSTRLDGQMTLERQIIVYKGQEVEKTVQLVHVQGRGVIRSSTSLKAKASKDRPVVVRAAGERARMLGGLLGAAADTSCREVAA